METVFKIIKLDRRIVNPSSLSEIIIEDPSVYSKSDLKDMLDMIHEGNKTSGGIVQVAVGFGIVGFVKFLDCFYLTIITQRKKVACIGGNFVFAIRGTEIFPIKPREQDDPNIFSKIWNKINKKINQTSVEIAESRYMGLFQFVDVTKDFFFSYTYDLTHSLQHNFVETRCVNDNKISLVKEKPNKLDSSEDIFVWNHYQVEGMHGIATLNTFCCYLTPLFINNMSDFCQCRVFGLYGSCVV